MTKTVMDVAVEMENNSEDLIKQSRDTQNVEEREKLLADAFEMKVVSTNIRGAISDVDESFGMDVSDSNVESLPDHIGGSFDKNNEEISINDKVVDLNIFRQREQIRQILTHEAVHKMNYQKDNDKERVIDLRVEEALTESATEEETGEYEAYKEYKPILDEVSSLTGVSKVTMIDMYRNGRNQEINKLIIEAESFKNAA